MEKDYSELLEKDFDVKINGSTCHGKLVGIDYDIGITIVSKEDPDNYLVCLRGEPVCRKMFPGHKFDLKLHNALFTVIADGIKAGVVDCAEYERVLSDMSGMIPGTASSSRCAFNQ